MDNQFCPGFLFADSRDFLIKLLDLFLNCGLVLGQFFFRESSCGGESEVSTSVPLDSGNSEAGWSFLCS